MKRVLSGSLLAISVALMLAGNASAQSIAMKVNIPFDFSVKDNAFEAGEYVVRVINNSVLSLQGPNGNVAVAMTNAIRAKKPVVNGYLVFSSYGDTYFLSSAFWPDYGDGRELVKSSSELELLARNSRTKAVKLNAEAQVRR